MYSTYTDHEFLHKVFRYFKKFNVTYLKILYACKFVFESVDWQTICLKSKLQRNMWEYLFSKVCWQVWTLQNKYFS